MVVFQMMERADDLTPVRNAFTALGRVADDGTAFEHEDVEASLSESLRSSTSGRTSTNDDDLTVNDVLDWHFFTSFVPIFDDVGDHHHHVLRLTCRESIELFLCSFKVGLDQDFGIVHAA